MDSGASMSEVFGKIQELHKSKQGAGRGGGIEKRRVTVREARPMIEEMEYERLLESVDVTKAAIAAVEESGIVFIDEVGCACCGSEQQHGSMQRCVRA